MGIMFRIINLLLMALVLATAANAIDYLKGTTSWDVAEIKGIEIGEFHPISWEFRSNDDSAASGTVEARGAWAGTWKDLGCDVIYCEMTSGGYDSWYITFVNPKYFIAYKETNGDYRLYRLGVMSGEYISNTLIGGA